MIYFLAVVLPPVAVLLCGKPMQALLNFILTLFVWVPGIVHAVLIVNAHKAEERNAELVRAMKDLNR